MESEEQNSFVVINNIPLFYHSADLRNFFSEHIECGSFLCFHFKHRPEVKRPKHEKIVDETTTFLEPRSTNPILFDRNTHTQPATEEKQRASSCCCIAKIKEDRIADFRKKYHKKHWLDRKGDSIPSLCSISQLDVEYGSNSSMKYKTRRELRTIPTDRDRLTLDELEKMPELQPPYNIMPNGNVGTPTKVFLELINQCKLPPKVISKLGLTFPKSRARHRYGNVPFEYPTSRRIPKYKQKASSNILLPVNSILHEEVDEVKTASGHVIESETDFELNAKAEKMTHEISTGKASEDAQSSADDDDDGCEEWERHEALTDDPANIERNKDRLFEERIELKWEKGGSGLVFYTDAQFWKAKEGDFDEQTADDWDVDMSIYYEENGGDRDSRDLMSMRQSKRRREGIEATDLKTLGFLKDSSKIGVFEKYSKGIGRKVLERQGWSEGQGLGSSTSGISETIDSEGQNPKDKRGLGFYGEKLIRKTFGANKRNKDGVIISTIYDNTSEIDPPEPLMRRNEPYHLKHRPINAPYQAFQKPADPALQILK